MSDIADPVEITLGDEKVHLRYTLGAAKRVNQYFGNFMNANQRIEGFDLEAITVIVAAGLGKPPKDVEEDVYAAGQLNLHRSVKTYLNLLANGGREYVEPADDAASETDSGNA